MTPAAGDSALISASGRPYATHVAQPALFVFTAADSQAATSIFTDDDRAVGGPGVVAELTEEARRQRVALHPFAYRKPPAPLGLSIDPEVRR